MNKLKYPKLFFTGLLLTLGLLVVALLCWFVSFLPPADGRFWGVIALLTPLILVANGFVLVFWLLRRRWWVSLLPLLAILFNGDYILSNFQYTRSSDEKQDLRVASLNAVISLLKNLGRKEFLQKKKKICLQYVNAKILIYFAYRSIMIGD